MITKWNALDRDASRKRFFRHPSGATAGGIAAVLLLLAGCGGQTGGDAPETGGDAPETGDSGLQNGCVAPAEWFPQSQTPEPDPTKRPTSFCDFHGFAWQSFLWLTADVGGGKLRFESFPTSQDAIDGNAPGAGGGTLRLSARAGKQDAPFDEVTQANENGIVVDQNGRAVYFSQQLNNQMLQDIVSQQWNDPAVLNEIDPFTEFAIGDVELKTAWKIVEDDEDVSGFFVREALIDRLVNVGGTIQADPENPIEAQVALVGMHVVGFINGHMEAIWATFEHNDNAPDFAPDQSPTAAVDHQDWTFYEKGTLALDCNQTNTSTVTLDEATQTLSPVTQVCRQYPYGMLPGAADQQNLIAITTLNESVWSQLPADSVTRNYFEVGAIWLPANSSNCTGDGADTTNCLQPNDNLQTGLTGSILLANSVIETFNQPIASQNNCFACHNTLMYYPEDPGDGQAPPLQGTNLNTSHIILEAYAENSKPRTQRGSNR